MMRQHISTPIISGVASIVGATFLERTNTFGSKEMVSESFLNDRNTLLTSQRNTYTYFFAHAFSASQVHKTLQ